MKRSIQPFALSLRLLTSCPFSASLVIIALLLVTIPTKGGFKSINDWQNTIPKAGDLDPTFGSGGKVRTDFFGYFDAAYAVAVQSDGKIIAAGSASDGISYGFGLVRYNFNGSLDTTFGNGGKVLTHFFGYSGGSQSVAIQGDGRIVAAGYTLIENQSYFALARYNSDGSLDSSFGKNGKVRTNVAGSNACSVKILTDNRILVGGTSYDGVTLARYNRNGTLDPSFGVGGIVVLNFGLGITSVALQPDGKIVGAGAINLVNDQSFLVIRLNSDGSLDQEFGENGKVVTDFYNNVDAALDVKVQPDGRIVVGGYAYGSPTAFISFALARYNLDIKCQDIVDTEKCHDIVDAF